MTPAPLTFNFHPPPVWVYAPGPDYVWCVWLCAIAGLIFAARYFRSLSSGGCSLSLWDIGYGPVLLGIFVKVVLGIVSSIIWISFFFINYQGTQSLSVDLLGYTNFIAGMLGYGLAGLMVWLTASRNQFGNVIFTALLFIVFNLSFLIFRLVNGHHPSRVGFTLAYQVLIASMFILGARLGQRIRPTKEKIGPRMDTDERG